MFKITKKITKKIINKYKMGIKLETIETEEQAIMFRNYLSIARQNPSIYPAEYAEDIISQLEIWDNK